jgi:hypothetical protein
MTLMNPKFPRKAYQKNYALCQNCGKPYIADPRGTSKYCIPCRDITKSIGQRNRYFKNKEEKKKLCSVNI